MRHSGEKGLEGSGRGKWVTNTAILLGHSLENAIGSTNLVLFLSGGGGFTKMSSNASLLHHGQIFQSKCNLEGDLSQINMHS